VDALCSVSIIGAALLSGVCSIPATIWKSEAGVENVDALKIDVEGFEDRVVREFFRDTPFALSLRSLSNVCRSMNG